MTVGDRCAQMLAEVGQEDEDKNTIRGGRGDESPLFAHTYFCLDSSSPVEALYEELEYSL